MPSNDVLRVQRAVERTLKNGPQHRRLLLAVSGGLDSMCLLDASAAVLPTSQLVVACFDHATGETAARAQKLVLESAGLLGVDAIARRAEIPGATEAEWREARWRFLRQAAESRQAAIATAHTRDDQVETVMIRVLRDAGARGLAGLSAPSEVLRPLLGVTRAELEAYAAARELRWVDDPSNASREFLRNRLRHDLLPAMRRVRPTIDDELLEIAASSTAWRTEVEELVERSVDHRSRHAYDDGMALDVARADLTGYSAHALAIIWPVLLAKAGVTVDRRGTHRLAEFTITGRVGSRIQLSGGWEVGCAHSWFELRRTASLPNEIIALTPTLSWEKLWQFSDSHAVSDDDVWCATLPDDVPLHVRRWLPGDSLQVGEGRTRRKVKHLLTRARIGGHVRARWPVVLAGDEIVWIPGVSRSDAATVRSGRPGLTYRCDFDDR